jgi:hypothetical protein
MRPLATESVARWLAQAAHSARVLRISQVEAAPATEQKAQKASWRRNPRESPRTASEEALAQIGLSPSAGRRSGVVGLMV